MAFTDQTTGGRVVKQGIMPIKITLTDTCHVGDLIGYEGVTDNEWQRADANGKVLAQLVAGEKCAASGDEITCFKMAVIEYPSTTSATTGDMVYLADDVGQYAATPATWVMQCVGEMVSTTEMFVHPSCSPVSAYASTGTSWAGYFRSELEAGRTGSTHWGGLRADVKAIAASVPGADVYGLYIFMQLQAASTGSAFIRLEDGCSEGVDSWFEFIPFSDAPPNFFTFSTLEPANGAWSDSTSCSNTSTGRIKVNMGGLTRYIPITSS